MVKARLSGSTLVHWLSFGNVFSLSPYEKRTWSFTWTNLHPHYSKICKEWLKLVSCSGDIKICYYLPLKRSVAQYLRAAHTFSSDLRERIKGSNFNKIERGPSFEQTWTPFTQGCHFAFFQVWLKLTQWLLYRRSIHVSYQASVAATSNDKKHSFIQEKYFDILNTLKSTH